MDITVRIPGFGQFVMGLHGVCDCNCTTNEVKSYDYPYIVYYHCNFFNRCQTVPFAI